MERADWEVARRGRRRGNSGQGAWYDKNIFSMKIFKKIKILEGIFLRIRKNKCHNSYGCTKISQIAKAVLQERAILEMS